MDFRQEVVLGSGISFAHVMWIKVETQLCNDFLGCSPLSVL